MQRTLEDFQFDPENALTMSQLTGQSTEERNATTLFLELLKSTEGTTATSKSVMIVTGQARGSGLEVLFAVLAANPTGRGRAIARADAGHTKWCTGLGQSTRAVWYDHRSDVFH